MYEEAAMSRAEIDSAALIAALAEEARRGAGEAREPEPEELVDYLAERLSTEDQERLGRQLVASPAAARALLDLADLEAAETSAGSQPTDLAAHAGWRDLKDRLPDAARRPRRLPPLLSTLAASLLLANLGLGSWVWRLQGELSRPVANVKNLELSASRAGAEETVELGAGEPLRLVFRPTERCPPYKAEVKDPRRRYTTDLRPDERGNLTLLFLRTEPGTYELRLYGCEPRRQLEEHRFRITVDGG